MKKHLLFILGFILIISCENGDSSNDLLSNSLSKKDSVDLANRIKGLSNYSEEDSLVFLSENIIKNYPTQKAESCVKIAHVFYKKSLLSQSKVYFNKSAEFYKEKGNQELYAEQITNVGVINENLGDYPTAINYYLQALSIFDSLGLELKKSFVYNDLGITYQQIGDKEQSINYYNKSLKICKSLGRVDLYASKYNNIASAYEEFDGNLDSALFYYSKSLEIVIKDSLERSTPVVMANIANIYIHQGKFKLADSLLNEANKLVDRNKNALYAILENRAILSLKLKDYVSSQKYAKQEIEFAKKSKFKEKELQGLGVLIECYEKEKKYELAYNALKEHQQLKLELAGADQKKEIERLNVRYEVEKKNNKIKVLELQKEASAKKTKILSIIAGLIILSLLILVYTFYIQKKHRELKIKSMQRDISDYIKQLHNFEEEIHEQELTHKELFLQKIKQFDLTEREEEVLLYISQGLKNTEIAEKMFVSVNTIKTHIKNIFVKLDVRNRIEAANKAKAL